MKIRCKSCCNEHEVKVVCYNCMEKSRHNDECYIAIHRTHLDAVNSLGVPECKKYSDEEIQKDKDLHPDEPYKKWDVPVLRGVD